MTDSLSVDDFLSQSTSFHHRASEEAADDATASVAMANLASRAQHGASASTSTENDNPLRDYIAPNGSDPPKILHNNSALSSSSAAPTENMQVSKVASFKESSAKLRVSDFVSVAFSAHPVAKMRHIREKRSGSTVDPTDIELGTDADTSPQMVKAHSLKKANSSKWNVIRKYISPEAQEAAAKSAGSPRTGKDRALERIVELQRMIEANPHRKRLRERLEKKKEDDFDGFLDKLQNELAITGELIFDWFTPKKTGQHGIWWSVIFMLAVFSVFFYMSAEYPFWLLVNDILVPDIHYFKERPVVPTGPNAMYEWVGFGIEPKWRTFDVRMLYDWGGRYGPAFEEGQHWRWVTSIFVHESAQHLFSNMNLYILLSIHLEAKYGTFCVFFIWLMAGVGGNLFSAMFEDSCTLVVGASGAVFGMFGLFTADMTLNFETIHRPILRIGALAAFLIYFIYTVCTEGSTSHYSHAGGFLCGLFPSFLFLPNFKAERWEMILPYLGAIVVVLTFMVFPTIIYTVKLDGLECYPNWANETQWSSIYYDIEESSQLNEL